MRSLLYAALGVVLTSAQRATFKQVKDTAWKCVISTSGTCMCSSNYSPASCEDGSGDGVGKYGLNEYCDAALSGAAMLEVSHFETEKWDDTIIIENVQGKPATYRPSFYGTKIRNVQDDIDKNNERIFAAPNKVVTSGPVLWRSDGDSESGVKTGFRICTGAAPAIPPTPPRPPSPPQPPPMAPPPPGVPWYVFVLAAVGVFGFWPLILCECLPFGHDDMGRKGLYIPLWVLILAGGYTPSVEKIAAAKARKAEGKGPVRRTHGGQGNVMNENGQMVSREQYDSHNRYDNEAANNM